MFTQEQATHFWNWFRVANDDYRQPLHHCRKKFAYIGHEFNVHLWDISPRLSFEIRGITGDSNDAVLTISCDADARYFKIARALVAAAPAIPGWRIRALLEPRDIDCCFEAMFPDMWFRPDSLFVMPGPHAKVPHRLECLYVYMPGYEEELESEYVGAAELILQNLLGEETVGNTLGVIVPMATEPRLEREDGIISIMELPGYVGRMHSGYAVDARGKIGKSTV